MTLAGFRAQNHPQQTGKRGARPEVDNLETPWDFFKPLDERFRFTLDVAALPHNAKCERYFSPVDKASKCMWAQHGECGPDGCKGCQNGGAGALALDGLTQSWAGERVWCNPPYSNIAPWVEKAWSEWNSPCVQPQLVVMLLPANRTEQGWWQREVEPFRDRADGLNVEFLPGRLRFIKHGHDRVEPNQRPPFGCCLLIWGEA